MDVRDHMVLDIAAARYAYQGAREQVARELTGYSSVRFYQRVEWLLGRPEVERERPAEVRRLRRLREARRGVRSTPLPPR